MRERWNGQDDDIRPRHDLFGLVADTKGLAVLVVAKVVDASNALFGKGISNPIGFAGKCGKDGNVAIGPRSDERSKDVDGIATTAKQYFLVHGGT